MYRIIIIDDEEIIREGLADLIDWRELGFSLVACFEDGKHAIDYLRDNPVDVVVTDIRMRETSGIEVAKFIYDHYQSIKVVILSGYKEFEYAKQAVEYNVAHYLLKPTDFDEVYRVFHGIKEKIDVERQNEQMTQSVKGKYGELVVAMQEQFFVDLLMGALRDEGEIRRRMALWELSPDPDQTRCIIIDCQIPNYDEYLEKRWKYGKEKFGTAIRNFIGGKKEAIAYFTIFNSGNEWLAVALFDSEIPQEEALRRVQGYLESVGQAVKTIMGLDIYLKIRTAYECILDIPGNGTSFMVSGNHEPFRENTNLSSDQYKLLINQYKLLMSNINDGDDKALNNLLSSMIKGLSALPLKTVQYLVIDLLAILTNKLMEMGVFMMDIFHEPIDYNGLLATPDIESLQDWLICLFKKIIRGYQEKKKTSADYVIKKVLDFIEENYHRDISLEDAAEQVFFNPVYLGRLLKKQTGEYFIDYITKLRIQKAKVLLIEKKFKAYEISEMVGYKNSKYFYRVFKKFTGYTPKEFVRLTGGKEVYDDTE